MKVGGKVILTDSGHKQYDYLFSYNEKERIVYGVVTSTDDWYYILYGMILIKFVDYKGNLVKEIGVNLLMKGTSMLELY